MTRMVTWEPGVRLPGQSVVAIGAFDGVHRGHQALLATVARDARDHDMRSVVVTFDIDPELVISPATASSQLLTLDQAVRFIGACGIETVLVVPFTPELATHSAEQFLDDVLGRMTDVAAVHVGRDFRFGERALGDIDTLYVWGVENNVRVVGHALVKAGGAPVTATRIRGLIAQGDVVGAADLLGRPHLITGAVVHGREQGRELGFPTANLEPVAHSALPSDGVYAGWALAEDGAVYKAGISVGVPPTFPEARSHLEVHLLDYAGDLYETTLTVAFDRQLREQRAFASLSDLTAAIAADVDVVGSLPAYPHGIDPLIVTPGHDGVGVSSHPARPSRGSA